MFGSPIDRSLTLIMSHTPPRLSNVTRSNSLDDSGGKYYFILQAVGRKTECGKSLAHGMMRHEKGRSGQARAEARRDSPGGPVVLRQERISWRQHDRHLRRGQD